MDLEVSTVLSHSLKIRTYENLTARVVRDVISNTDNTIDEFEKAFQNLWKSLRDRFAVDQINQTHRLVHFGAFEALHLSMLAYFDLQKWRSN